LKEFRRCGAAHFWTDEQFKTFCIALIDFEKGTANPQAFVSLFIERNQ